MLTSSKDTLFSLFMVNSATSRLTSIVLALFCNEEFNSYLEALGFNFFKFTLVGICFSRSLITASWFLTTSVRALKVRRITYWIFRHSFVFYSRSSTIKVEFWSKLFSLCSFNFKGEKFSLFVVFKFFLNDILWLT